MMGAWLAAAAALVLIAVNGRRFPYGGLTILALMFTGTMLHRAEQGQIGRGRAATVAAGVFAAAILAGAWPGWAWSATRSIYCTRWCSTSTTPRRSPVASIRSACNW